MTLNCMTWQNNFSNNFAIEVRDMVVTANDTVKMAVECIR